MIYLPELKLGFLHYLRTGGTSISQWVDQYYPNRILYQLDHWHEPLANKIKAGFIMEGNQVFTSIRNPYELIHGVWSIWRQTNSPVGHVLAAKKYAFRPFVKWFTQINPQLRAEDMIKPYEEYYRVNGTIPSIRILHLEKLQEEFTKLMQEAGCPYDTTLPRINTMEDPLDRNTGKLKRRHRFVYTPSLYDRETANGVTRMFEWTFNTGHYSTNWHERMPLRSI